MQNPISIPLVDESGLLNSLLVDNITITLVADPNSTADLLIPANRHRFQAYRRLGITIKGISRWNSKRVLKFSAIYLAKLLFLKMKQAYGSGLTQMPADTKIGYRNALQLERFAGWFDPDNRYTTIQQCLSVLVSNLAYSYIEKVYNDFLEDLHIDCAFIGLNKIELAFDISATDISEKLLLYNTIKNNAVSSRDVILKKDNLGKRDLSCKSILDRTSDFEISGYDKTYQDVEPGTFRQEIRITGHQLHKRDVYFSLGNWDEFVAGLNSEFINPIFNEGRIMSECEFNELRLDFKRKDRIDLFTGLLPIKNKTAVARVLQRLLADSRIKRKLDERGIIKGLRKRGLLEPAVKCKGIYNLTRKGLLMVKMLKGE